MSQFQLDEEAIFDFARRIESPELRADYLDQACGPDRELKDRVAELLQSHDDEQSFLERPPAELAQTVDAPRVTEKPGDTIGRYKLLQKIGEGGFGVVYMAEQTRPVRRKVALKVIKPGMDTKDVIARFEAERQALAMMNHPNIAKIHDGGETDSGRPYFVMELVKGIPLTQFCDEQKLPTKERLQLFGIICSAIQHAHQKGIIHRDIKPANVMVTLHDGQPIPKVIDFGVSKAINQQLTERTLFTKYGQMVGTPQYMSPEQAEMSGLDVDTRSDIYSLGVLLYELLTGTTPLEVGRLRKAGFAEMQRLIKEEEAPKPSTRVSGASERVTTVAQQRGISPEALRRCLRGELDWVAMKALEKDRNRRYETANGLARDIERYLNSEPVAAGAPTTAYRLRKFAARNRGLVISSSAVAASLLLGFALAVGGYFSAKDSAMVARQNASEAERARDDANRQRELAQQRAVEIDQQRLKLAGLLADRDKALFFVRDYCVLLAMTGEHKNEVTALKIAEKTGATSAWTLMIRGFAALNRDENEKSVSLFRQALDQEPSNLSCKSMLCIALLTSGDLDQYRIIKSEIATATPQNREERMYSALALILDEVAYPRIASVIESHDSPLANAIFADVVSQHAIVTGDTTRVLEAIDRIESVIQLAGNNALLPQVALKLRHLALVHDLASDPQQTKREARQNVDSLSELRPNYLMGQLQIAEFLDRFGSKQESREAWLRILENRNSGFLQAYPVVAMTLVDGEFGHAADLLEGNQQFLSRIWRAYCVFRRDNRERSDELDELYESLKNADPNPVYSHLDLLGLMGPLPELIKESQIFLKTDRFSTATEFVRGTSQFYARPDDPKALQNLLGLSQNTEDFTSRVYYTIAVVRLLQAEATTGRESGEHREEANGMIDKIIAGNDYQSTSFYWAKSMKAILARDAPPESL